MGYLSSRKGIEEKRHYGNETSSGGCLQCFQWSEKKEVIFDFRALVAFSAKTIEIFFFVL